MEKRRTIGILTWRQGTRFEEPGYLRQLIKEGRKLGALVYLFSHQDVFKEQRKVRGFVPDPKGGWEARLFPWPDVVIDRCRKGEEGYKELRRQKHLFTYANSTYTNKWNATRLFSQSAELQRWIPKTVAYSPQHLSQMLKEFPIIYVKPGNGTGGRSILQISRTADGFRLLGRARNLVKKSAHFASLSSLVKWLNQWVESEKIRNGHFMIQQGLDLSLIPNRVSDTRLLIQKDEYGEWHITGAGVRVGPKNSPTSNLHGGGKPIPFQRLMVERFGEAKAREIYAECKLLAYEVVKLIEKYFGSMMEFGLDIGVDVNGRVWLIEVNPKPGREIFKQLGNPDLYRKAVQRPLQYALYLARGKQNAALEERQAVLTLGTEAHLEEGHGERNGGTGSKVETTTEL